MRTPNVTPFDNILWGADATSPGDAWAVGAADTGSSAGMRPVILRWNGTSWLDAGGPMPAGGGELRAVDAVSPSDAWAVGFSNTSTGARTLIERWDGTDWTVVPSPGAQSYLLGIKAFSANDAWAVGSGSVPGSFALKTHVQRWKGTRWAVVPSPSPDPRENHLYDVDGVSSSDLWAVGYTQSDPYATRQALILHYDGSSWRTVPAPSAPEASLEGVVALASDDVWAVGWEFSLQLFWHVPYAIHWDGSTWTKVPMPSPSPQGGRLFDVAALSPTNLYAVGHSNSSSGVPSLAMRWNGSQWSVEATPSRSTVSYLWSAASASPSTVLAVGNGRRLVNGTLGPSQTLALRTVNG